MAPITKQQIPVLAARLVEFQGEFNGLSSEDGQFVIMSTKEAIKIMVEAVKNRQPLPEKVSILKLISCHENLMIEASDGKAYISDAKNIFKSGIDGDFKYWGLNKPGPATEEILVDVNEMVGDGTFVQIFTTISSDLEKLVMTQAQIIRFCEKHPTWLRQEGYTTLFLTKVGYEYFVVIVHVYAGGLRVLVGRLGYDDVGDGQDRHRVVSPQLTPSVA